MLDKEEIKDIKNMTMEDAQTIEVLVKQKKPNWRLIYTLYYDVLRKLCEALIRLEGIKISNHQGTFAYIGVNYSELELDWNFFEKIRTKRNRNKYEGTDITQQDWKETELQFKLYIKTIKQAIEEKV